MLLQMIVGVGLKYFSAKICNYFILCITSVGMCPTSDHFVGLANGHENETQRQGTKYNETQLSRTAPHPAREFQAFYLWHMLTTRPTTASYMATEPVE